MLEVLLVLLYKFDADIYNLTDTHINRFRFHHIPRFLLIWNTFVKRHAISVFKSLYLNEYIPRGNFIR